MRNKIRILINICIVVMVAASWGGMVLFGGGSLSTSGLASLKYFTVLSNLFVGIASIVWLACLRKGGSEAAERLKYIATTAVALTFITVMVFLGPLYGYPEMLAGVNLWLHLVVPVIAISEMIFFSDTVYTRKDNRLVIIPPLVYGSFYLGNIFINGIGEWPDTNDWYLFLRWGYPVGILIFIIIGIITWLAGFIMRKTQRHFSTKK